MISPFAAHIGLPARAQLKRKAAGDVTHDTPPTRRQRRSIRDMNDLPDKVVQNVVNKVHAHEQAMTSLHALTLVNRRFHTLSIPSLCHGIDFNTADKGMPRPALLLRTLLDNPSLANFVRNSIWEPDSKTVDLENKAVIVARVRDWNIPNKEHWLALLELGSRDAFLACIICLLPKLAMF